MVKYGIFVVQKERRKFLLFLVSDVRCSLRSIPFELSNSFIFLDLTQIFLERGPQNFWSFMSSYLPLFIAFLLTIFGNFQNLEFYVRQFFKKISKISKKFFKFFQLSQNKQNVIILPK